MGRLTREQVEEKIKEIQERNERANLRGAILFLANGRDMHLFLENHSGPDLPWEDCENLTIADLSGSERVDLNEADLSGLDLSGLNLVEASLTKANLSRADLSEANLSAADLYFADLTKVNLSRAKLSEAHLTGVNLNGANLREANLSGADLTEAYLHLVDWNGADFNGAIVGGTIFREVDLHVVKALDTVKHIRPSYIDIDAISNLPISDPSVDFDKIPKVKVFLQRAGVKVEELKLYPWPSPPPEIEAHWLNSQLSLAQIRLKRLQENQAVLEEQNAYQEMKDLSLPLKTVLKLIRIETEIFQTIIFNIETKLSNLDKLKI